MTNAETKKYHEYMGKYFQKVGKFFYKNSVLFLKTIYTLDGREN